MDNRIMVKVERAENYLYFRTICRAYKSPHGFVIPRKQLLDLEDRRTADCEDCGSFAQMRLDPSDDELSISFIWLSEYSDGTLKGRKQIVRLPYSTLAQFAAESYDPNGQNKLKLLSCNQDKRPALVFKGTKNLRSVIAIPMLRHKLFACLNRHFRWPNSREIVFYNDFAPYSFFFQETLPNGMKGICGGVILHGLDQGRAKSYYSVHT